MGKSAVMLKSASASGVATRIVIWFSPCATLSSNMNVARICPSASKIVTE